MKTFWASIFALALLSAVGCDQSPVPDGVYLTLSVSAGDVAVKTAVNGRTNEFFSGASGSMAAAGPLNKDLKAGGNTVSFLISPAADAGLELAPEFLATLEVSLAGEMIDTLSPGERVMFSRALNEAERRALQSGDTVSITETFSVDREKLAALAKDS